MYKEPFVKCIKCGGNSRKIACEKLYVDLETFKVVESWHCDKCLTTFDITEIYKMTFVKREYKEVNLSERAWR